MKEQFSTKKKTIEPAGLIEEFNALGNHPEDMYKCIEKELLNTLERVGKADKYTECKKTLFDALDSLSNTPKTFSGHYVPNEKTKPVLDFLVDKFVDIDESKFEGKENFDQALDLINSGNNVLMIQNHTSPMDALVPLALLKKNYGDLPISIVMSQVFEYARVTNLITSGVDKFPVFQPKHMNRFADKPDVINKMSKQNITALRSLLDHTKDGGKMIFLYPERDRNSNGMGVPEPASMVIPEVISKSNKDLYILPSFVSEIDTIFPNNSGRNELDDFFKIIQRGHGNLSCGKPVKYTEILRHIESLSQKEKKEIFDYFSFKDEDPKKTKRFLCSVAMLGLISKLSGDNKMKGLYKDKCIEGVVNNMEDSK